MSRVENAIQPSRHDRWISHQLQHIPCGRCCAVIEYGRGTEWSVINELVNEHWKACPGRPHVRATRMARTPTSLSDTEIVLPPPATSKQPFSANPVAQSVGSQNNITYISAGCERKRRTLEQRKMELEQDEYAKNVTTKSVVCGGCHKEISLDKRSMYYPGLWLKHRGKCPSIEKLERAKARAQQAQNGTRQASYEAGIPMSRNRSDEDEAQLGGAERYESRSVASTHRSVTYDDSDDPSSEDEAVYEELPPQEPFPLLNSKFFASQRQHKRSQWAYRYATKEEIDTNLFQGQNEEYPRQEFTRHCGEYCAEARRCVIANRVDKQFQIPTASGQPRS